LAQIVLVGTNHGMAVRGANGSQRVGSVNHVSVVSAGPPTASIFSLLARIALATTYVMVKSIFPANVM
jgi:hypothetical protein